MVFGMMIVFVSLYSYISLNKTHNTQGCDSTGEVTTTAPDPSNDDHPSSVLTYVPWVIAVTALVFGLCVVLM
jgi:hypothetical protein